MKHLTPEELSAHLDGALEGAARGEAERHLSDCEACRSALASLAAQDDALRPALAHHPGEPYFETFAARVEDRIRAAGLRGAQSRLGDDGFWGWLRSPRRLAAVGAVAVVIVGAAIVIVTARLERPEVESMLSRRVEQAAPSTAAPAPSTAAAPEPVPAPSAAAAPEQKLATPTDLTRPARDDDRTAALRKDEARTQASGAPTSASLEQDKMSAAGGIETRSKAATGRLIPSRRGANGESVPLNRAAAPFATPPKEQATAPGGPVRILKPGLAAPARETSPTNEAGAADESGSLAAEVQLCGRVVDPSDRPVAGALVVLPGRGRTAITDQDGHFCLSAAPGTQQLAALAVGYLRNQIQVQAGDGAPEVRLTLQPVAVIGPGLRTPGGVPKAAAPEAGMAGKDPFAGQADEARVIVSQAQQLARKAHASGAAADFERAAGEWERALPMLNGNGLHEARFRLAEARFLAWRSAATAARDSAATDALIAFLRWAPVGTHRDQAAGWLAELKR